MSFISVCILFCAVALLQLLHDDMHSMSTEYRHCCKLPFIRSFINWISVFSAIPPIHSWKLWIALRNIYYTLMQCVAPNKLKYFAWVQCVVRFSFIHSCIHSFCYVDSKKQARGVTKHCAGNACCFSHLIRAFFTLFELGSSQRIVDSSAIPFQTLLYQNLQERSEFREMRRLTEIVRGGVRGEIKPHLEIISMDRTREPQTW